MARNITNQKNRKNRWCDPVTWFTAILALFTVIQVFAFIESERAFVFPSETSFAKSSNFDVSPLPMFLYLKNSGKITATIDELIAKITHGPLLQEPDYTGIGNRYAFPPVVANGNIRRILRFESGWSKEITEQVFSGAKTFYLYGRIKYHDHFSFLGPKESRFCFVWYASVSAFETCSEPAYTSAD
jgi:hypothetical protein